MTTDDSLGLDESYMDSRSRDSLALVVDVLLPGTQQLPSGRSVGVHLGLLDMVLRVDAGLVPVVRRVARAASDRESCTLDDIVTWSEGDVEELVRALNLAYYMSRDVMDALGYWGQSRRPVAEATADEQWDEELLAPVRARGPVYVPTPD